MRTTQESWGRTREGDEITRFTLLAASGVTVQLVSYGATLSSVQTPDRRGSREEITLGFDALDGYLNPHPYFGSTGWQTASRAAVSLLMERHTCCFATTGGTICTAGRKGSTARYGLARFSRGEA